MFGLFSLDISDDEKMKVYSILEFFYDKPVLNLDEVKRLYPDKYKTLFNAGIKNNKLWIEMIEDFVIRRDEYLSWYTLQIEKDLF